MTILVAITSQNNAAKGSVATSTDGVTWLVNNGITHNGNGTDASWQAICYSPDLNLFCAVGSSTANVSISSDGLNWQGALAALPAQTWKDVCWSKALGLFCAVANDGLVGAQVATSPDGRTWTARTSVAALVWTCICWSPVKNLFVAVAAGGTNPLMTSPDGITWTQRTFTDIGAQGVAWDTVIGAFCIVGNSGVGSTSPDGITWTNNATGPTGGVVHRVRSKNNLGTFIASGHNGTMATSTNGTTWTSAASVNGAFSDNYDVCWSVNLGLYAACAGGTDTAAMSTSPDGATWTARALTISDPWVGVVDNYAPPILYRSQAVIVGG